MASSVILEEEYDEAYEPTDEEVFEYAKFLGMDPDTEKHLLWIARDSLKAPLPSDWKPCQTDDGNIYYFNFKTGVSIWDHPCDEHFRTLYQTEKKNAASASGAASKPNDSRLDPSTSKSSPLYGKTELKSVEKGLKSDAKTAPVGVPALAKTTVGSSINVLDDLELSSDEDLGYAPWKKSSSNPNTSTSALTTAPRSNTTISGITMASIAKDGAQDRLAPLKPILTPLGGVHPSLRKSEQSSSGDDHVSDMDGLLTTKMNTDAMAHSSANKPALLNGMRSIDPKMNLTAISTSTGKSLNPTLLPASNYLKSTKPSVVPPFQDLLLKENSSKSSLNRKVNFDDDFDLVSEESDLPSTDRLEMSKPSTMPSSRDKAAANKSSLLTRPVISPQQSAISLVSNLGSSHSVKDIPTSQATATTLTTKQSYIKTNDVSVSKKLTEMSQVAPTTTTTTASKINQLKSLNDVDDFDDFDDSDTGSKQAIPTSLTSASANLVSKNHDSVAATQSNLSKEIPGTNLSSYGDTAGTVNSLQVPSTNPLPKALQSQSNTSNIQPLNAVKEKSSSPSNDSLVLKPPHFKGSDGLNLEAEKEKVKSSIQEQLTKFKTEQDAELAIAKDTIKANAVIAIETAQQEAKRKLEVEIQRIRNGFSVPPTSSQSEKGDGILDDPLILKKRAEFETELNRLRDQLDQEYRKKNDKLVSDIQEEYRSQLEATSKTMRDEAHRCNKEKLNTLKESLDAELNSLLETEKSSMRNAEEVCRKESQARIDALEEKVGVKESEAIAAERQIEKTYENMKTTWKHKLADLEQDMLNAEKTLKSKPPVDDSISRELKVMREDTERELADERERRKNVDRMLNDIDLKEREVKKLQADTEQITRDERERRRRVDMLLDDIIVQERNARARLDETLAEISRQETAAQTRRDVAISEESRLEHDSKLKQQQLVKIRDSMERERRDIELKRSQYREESRHLELQASQKRQAAIDLGPLESDIDTRRQELVRERLDLEGSESDLKTQRRRIEDEKFKLSLMEKEVVLLRKQLESEKQSLEMAQTELVSERRCLSIRRAKTTLGEETALSPGKNHSLGYIQPEDKKISNDINSSASIHKGSKHRRSKRTKKHGPQQPQPMDDSSQISSYSLHSSGSECITSKSSMITDSRPILNSLEQLRIRIRQEEQELKDAKKLLQSPHLGTDEKSKRVMDKDDSWGASATQHNRNQALFPSAYIPRFNADDHNQDYAEPRQAYREDVSMAFPISERDAPSLQTNSVLPISTIHPLSMEPQHLRKKPQCRSESLDNIEGELNKLLVVLKEQRSPSDATPKHSTLQIDRILSSYPSYTPGSSSASYSLCKDELQSGLAHRAVQRHIPSHSHGIGDRALELPKSLSSFMMDRTLPTSMTDRTTSTHRINAWDADNLHNKALLSDHDEWLKRFNARISN
ncbi:hypothetical protein BASA60_000407 [Batrachochytrium salamandrivorans]|nr:hypothetical protein BASA60_000407 [Batrachochytrium salamandrivorans]